MKYVHPLHLHDLTDRCKAKGCVPVYEADEVRVLRDLIADMAASRRWKRRLDSWMQRAEKIVKDNNR